jgi:3-oxoacyl-[acyl-carrier protein] reductase
MDLGLASKCCAVTGASRGIGRATARMLAAEGASVLLVARGSEALEEAAEESEAIASASGGRVAPLALDVTDPDAGERVVAACEERLGTLDVLVNNAGTARWRDLDQVPEADWYEAWELNVMAPLRAMRAAVPGMVERGWGRIVNVASTAAKRPSAQMPEYSVAKAAELSLSRLFADRHANEGVLVNAVCPGPTKSELWMDEGGLLDQSQELGGIETREQALQAAGGKRPIGRLAEVEEIAAAIVFLCSERASYVAGAAWSVDGGTVQVIL